MNETNQELKQAFGAVTIWGVLTIILGILAMGSPLVTGMALAVLIGIALLVSGLSQTVYAFKSSSLGQGLLLRVLFGGITAVAGLVAIAQPGMALVTLTLFLAIYFVIDGVMTLVASSAVSEGKGWVIFNGLLTLVLGLMIWQGYPLSGVWAVGILVGVRLVFAGMTMLALGSTGRQAIRQE
jgi:uncharacterized membrane protein HdeD (DUF308 family)